MQTTEYEDASRHRIGLGLHTVRYVPVGILMSLYTKPL